jgi:hypothetical protein
MLTQFYNAKVVRWSGQTATVQIPTKVSLMLTENRNRDSLFIHLNVLSNLQLCRTVMRYNLRSTFLWTGGDEPL